ncbi:MAG: polysulfide reductase NrfD [Gemmatimonadota bacterium]|nr:polysulfide reductase NrfD [Gemmatimonadota bacterium]MDE3172350.1 polysulfide reductase NrfD [Gemmatimonadota bacterium]MDE3215769.1 polysulfide reductase NrfD [Gemmatimonadota bacterium]
MTEATLPAALRVEPLVQGDVTLAGLDDHIRGWTERKPPRAWYVAITITSLTALMGFAAIGYMLYEGIGIIGNSVPVVWGFLIINFVFWVGIGHAGTLISVILYLFRQRWRNAISRIAEATTVFAFVCAMMFPAIHVGRPWFPYWLVPYPNQRGMWVDFRSPLIWDVFAVLTYFTVSLLFWYLGLVPDFATLRATAKSRTRRAVYRLLSWGWVGNARQWVHYEKGYLLLAGMTTVLALSVHSIVSMDFAVSQLPGWHMTIFPPYFVVGAAFSGFAGVVLVFAFVRTVMQLENYVTMRHMDLLNRMVLFLACVMTYAYLMEGFTAWYSADPFVKYIFANYVFGDQWWAGTLTIFLNCVLPQLLWFPKFRRSVPVMVTVSAGVTVGMWMERYTIVILSLHRGYLPSSWGMYLPTRYDFMILFGSIGLFLTLLLLFLRKLPVIAAWEVKPDIVFYQKQSAEAGHA